jgi:serine/threonine protein kinase
MQSPPDQQLLDGTDRFPFSLSAPRLLSHKPRSQVIQCDYTEGNENTNTACMVKLFSPRARVAYEKEEAVYSLEEVQKANITASRIWSGLWTSSQYQTLLDGKLPSILRRTENQVRVLVLSHIERSKPLSRFTASSRLQAVRAALRELRRLHTLGIVHGDPSADNVLIQVNGEKIRAKWIDFSASVTTPSETDTAYEWQKAIEYYSDFVSHFRESR